MNTVLGLCAGYCKYIQVVTMLGARNRYQRELVRTNPLPFRSNGLGLRVVPCMVIARFIMIFRDLEIVCGERRVYRLMKAQGLKPQTGYRKPRHHGTKASVTAPNYLAQQFNVLEPSETWITDITHIRTKALAIAFSERLHSKRNRSTSLIFRTAIGLLNMGSLKSSTISGYSN